MNTTSEWTGVSAGGVLAVLAAAHAPKRVLDGLTARAAAGRSPAFARVVVRVRTAAEHREAVGLLTLTAGISHLSTSDRQDVLEVLARTDAAAGLLAVRAFLFDKGHEQADRDEIACELGRLPVRQAALRLLADYLRLPRDPGRGSPGRDEWAKHVPPAARYGRSDGLSNALGDCSWHYRIPSDDQFSRPEGRYDGWATTAAGRDQLRALATDPSVRADARKGILLALARLPRAEQLATPALAALAVPSGAEPAVRHLAAAAVAERTGEPDSRQFLLRLLRDPHPDPVACEAVRRHLGGWARDPDIFAAAVALVREPTRDEAARRAALVVIGCRLTDGSALHAVRQLLADPDTPQATRTRLSILVAQATDDAHDWQVVARVLADAADSMVVWVRHTTVNKAQSKMQLEDYCPDKWQEDPGGVAAISVNEAGALISRLASHASHTPVQEMLVRVLRHPQADSDVRRFVAQALSGHPDEPIIQGALRGYLTSPAIEVGDKLRALASLRGRWPSPADEAAAVRYVLRQGAGGGGKRFRGEFLRPWAGEAEVWGDVRELATDRRVPAAYRACLVEGYADRLTDPEVRGVVFDVLRQVLLESGKLPFIYSSLLHHIVTTDDTDIWEGVKCLHLATRNESVQLTLLSRLDRPDVRSHLPLMLDGPFACRFVGHLVPHLGHAAVRQTFLNVLGRAGTPFALRFDVLGALVREGVGDSPLETDLFRMLSGWSAANDVPDARFEVERFRKFDDELMSQEFD